MTAPLLPTRFLFRFAAPCRRREPLWTPDGPPLDESYRLPSLAQLEGRPVWAEFRAAWSEAGLVVAAMVESKKAESAPVPLLRNDDGLHLWIDTRDVHDIHRAGRFCHRFRFSLSKAEVGPRKAETKTKRKSPASRPTSLAPYCLATGEWLPIERSKEQPRPVGAELLGGRCQWREDGYLVEAFIPAEALTGFDPAEHPRLGFACAMIDRQLGEQTFGVGSPMPYREDPSLWATLELVGE